MPPRPAARNGASATRRVLCRLSVSRTEAARCCAPCAPRSDDCAAAARTATCGLMCHHCATIACPCLRLCLCVQEEGAQLSERASLVAQLAAGRGSFAGGEQGGIADMASMFGMGGGGGLGGLAALAESSGLLPPGVKRLLKVLQFVLRIKAAVQSAWERIGPIRPYLLACVLLFPLARFLWAHVIVPLLTVLGARLRAAPAPASVRVLTNAVPARVADFALLVGAVLHDQQVRSGI